MNGMARYRRVLACLGCVALLAACQPRDRLSEEDRLARIDDYGAEIEKVPPEPASLFPDTALGRQLEEHMLILALPAEQADYADGRYAESLEHLRRTSAETVRLLNDAYGNIEVRRYFERWCLAKTAADLEVAEAYPLLRMIARAPIPTELHDDTHHFSTQEEEVMIRLRAVYGLASLAVRQHLKADEDLLALASDDEVNMIIRVRAVKGYLRAGRDYAARERILKSRLPQDLHGMVTLDTTPPRDFEARVTELAAVSDDDTSDDTYEEHLDEESAPTAGQSKKESP